MKQYLELMQDILDNGADKEDRTGTGTRSVFGRQMRFDLSKGFPLVTTKKLHLRSIIHELLWFLNGDTNTAYLKQNGVSIWDEWADEKGDLGPVYGAQWRSYNGNGDYYGNGNKGEVEVDQLTDVIENIKNNPISRRHIISSWNVPQIPEMALSPCHCFMQFKVYGDTLHLQLYQRSGDLFLGIPFNIASYAILLSMVAQVTNLKVGEFIHTIGDAHIYNNHKEQVAEQLKREPMPLPKLWLNPNIKNIDDFKFEDIKILDYKSHPTIKGDVAV